MNALASTLGLQAAADLTPVMGLGGWLFMGLAWLAVASLLVWSYVRVLSGSADGSDTDPS